jgi:hypothetical protein
MPLEQPFILPTRAHKDQDPVNYNLFTTFKKSNKQKIGNRSSSTSASAKESEFTIIWMPNPNAQDGQIITWRYPDQNCRDQDYSDLISKISVPLGPNNT